MSSIQHYTVSPALPTALGEQTHLELPGYDIWFHYANTLHIVPAVLDVSKFEEALSRTLQLYPHGAGRFRHIDGRWVIELTNTPVPLDIEYRVESTSDSLLNSDWTVQDDISSFTSSPPMGPNIFDGSAPLICVKLTFLKTETCIGSSWQHSLGDGTTHFRFLHTLSQFYQGLSTQFAVPSFKRPHFPLPSDSVVAEIWPHVPYLHKTYSFEELAAISLQPFESARWRIDNRDLDELHSALSSKQQNDQTLSRQDCITSYLVSSINHSSSEPLQSVRNSSTYRHIKAPFIEENAASNLIMSVGALVPSDIVGIATTVRKARIHARDPDYIYRWLTVASSIKSKAYNAGKALGFPGFGGELFVNVLTRIDWWSVHFGCPNGTRFYFDGPHINYVTVTGSNPIKGADGVWRTRQTVDISMGVAPGMKRKLLETVALGVRHLLKDERARL